MRLTSWSSPISFLMKDNSSESLSSGCDVKLRLGANTWEAKLCDYRAYFLKFWIRFITIMFVFAWCRHSAVAVNCVAHPKQGCGFKSRLGPYYVECASSPSVSVGSLYILQLLPTVHRHTGGWQPLAP